MKTLSEQCISCKKTYELKVKTTDIERINNGEHIQNVMPHLSADERELLISGICGKCFDKIIIDNEDDY